MRDDREQAASRVLATRRGIAEEGLVIVGVSTGGPSTLEAILPQLPADFPWPVLVAQHMPGAFTKSFADRLNQACALRVVEAASPMPVEPGTVYIARGGADMVVAKRAGKLTVLPKPESSQHLWHPSVELLGRSVLEHCDPARVTAVMLTGMGYDGSDAFTEIKQRGGRTIAESEASCVVFGMPRELIEKRGASMVLAAEKIAAQLNVWAGR
jgi:two-component system chemotaxis response regulator CheB